MNELLTAAVVTPSWATERLPSHMLALRNSFPDHSSSILSVPTSTRVTALLPRESCTNKICAGEVHASQLAEPRSLGVTLRGSPPLALMINTSPPVDASSLINPAMKAILLPSGEQRGMAICNGGL